VSQSRPNSLPPGTVVNERYRVVGPVGHGGLGTVYQVSDILFGKSNIYALKEQWDQSDSARKQFAREGAWLKALTHHHIPKVIEYFEWHGRLYLVMDFVDGENLEQKLERAAGRPLPEAQVLAWVFPICDALQFLHTRLPPIIHRDVKPSNIIVTPAGHPVLVDLGIAKEHAPGLNATATFVRKAGTEGYAPPEQYAAAGQAGPWSDVYGLGATLYHLLTAHIPPTAVERIALDATLRHPRELNPTVSPPTDTAILRALAIRPQERFRSMAEFKQALMAAWPASPALTPPSPLPFAASPPAQITRPSDPHVGGGGTFAAPAMTAPADPARVAPPLSTGAPVPMPTRPRSTWTGESRTPAHPTREANVRREQRGGPQVRPAVWIVSLAAIAVLMVIAIVGVMRIYAPLDRSTPSATVAGYFDALRAQDYHRAWQYMAANSKNQTSEADFARSLSDDDARLGRVISAAVGAFQQDTIGHELGTVRVVRAGAPDAPITYSVVLTQYGDLWLIDSISGT
jgi:serine/threonine protein kinase